MAALLVIEANNGSAYILVLHIHRNLIAGGHKTTNVLYVLLILKVCDVIFCMLAKNTRE